MRYPDGKRHKQGNCTDYSSSYLSADVGVMDQDADYNTDGNCDDQRHEREPQDCPFL